MRGEGPLPGVNQKVTLERFLKAGTSNVAEFVGELVGRSIGDGSVADNVGLDVGAHVRAGEA